MGISQDQRHFYIYICQFLCSWFQIKEVKIMWIRTETLVTTHCYHLLLFYIAKY
jgi:hypothetical protein